MVGYGQVTLGSIFLIIAILLFVGTGWVIYTYFDGVETIEDEKKDRDLIKSLDGDTTMINETIKEHEDTLNFKRIASTSCSILALIFLVCGVFLIVRWRKEKKREAQEYYPTKPTQYPPPPPTWLQYPQQQIQVQQPVQQPNPQQNLQNGSCPICQNLIPIYSNPCPKCGATLNW